MSESRDKILDVLRKAKKNDPVEVKVLYDNMRPLYRADTEERINKFRLELEKVSGEFHLMENFNSAADLISRDLKDNSIDRIFITDEVLCRSIAERIDNNIELVKSDTIKDTDNRDILSAAPVSLVNASYAIADTGTLVFIYDDCGSTMPHFLPETVIVVIHKEKLLADMIELFEKISSEKAGNMVFVTGPSRTADIEKVLVLGAHGPKRLVVLMMEGGL